MFIDAWQILKYMLRDVSCEGGQFFLSFVLISLCMVTMLFQEESKESLSEMQKPSKMIFRRNLHQIFVGLVHFIHQRFKVVRV